MAPSTATGTEENRKPVAALIELQGKNTLRTREPKLGVPITGQTDLWRDCLFSIMGLALVLGSEGGEAGARQLGVKDDAGPPRNPLNSYQSDAFEA